MEQTGSLDRGDGVALAWAKTVGRAPTVVFLGGYRSDMSGSKAAALAEWAARHGQAFLRFDPSGHGASGGAFEHGTIGIWTADALAVIDAHAPGSLVLVGSSMGGWLAVLVALARPGRVQALVGIAAAPDFTEDLMWASMLPAERATLLQDGVLLVPSDYGAPAPVTRDLIEDGRTHLILRDPIPLDIPVRLLHGQVDRDVPWESSLRLAARLASHDVEVTLIKDGDHRLSRPADLARLVRTLDLVLEDAA